MEGDARWIYADVARGFAEAKRTGNRCSWCCAACRAWRAWGSMRACSRSLRGARCSIGFVCVRVIDANAIDLALFQFDYDLSFSTLFFNGDGTIYGRYGSWTHQKNAQDTDTASFRRALDARWRSTAATRQTSRRWPGSKACRSIQNAGGDADARGKYQPELDWQGRSWRAVHCHQVGDAFRASFRERGEAIPEWIYPQPAPETIGLTLAPDQIARVEAVLRDRSPSRRVRAGMRSSRWRASRSCPSRT